MSSSENNCERPRQGRVKELAKIYNKTSTEKEPSPEGIRSGGTTAKSVEKNSSTPEKVETSRNTSPDLQTQYKMIETNPTRVQSGLSMDEVEEAHDIQVNTDATQEKLIRKSVDSIEDWCQILELMELLNLKSEEDDIELEVLKSTLKNVIEKQRSGKIAEFSAISKAREEDMKKRKVIERWYSKVEDCLGEADDELISTLNDEHYGGRDAREVLAEKKARLEKKDYHLLFAGETSAGKSSLINLILGEEVLHHHVLGTTSTICEVKYGEERKLVFYKKYDEGEEVRSLSESTVHLKLEKDCGKSYREQVKDYVSTDRTQTETESKYEKIEVFWPHDLLKAGTVIIDSPGFGESDEMDKILMNYLPNAFGFIYVIDVSNAGGMNQPIKEKFRQMLGKIQSIDGRTGNVNRLTECSLFVCNKWDQVHEEERSKVQQHVVEQLSVCWESENLNKQIVYLSTKKALEVQEYGGVTTEYDELLRKLKHAVVRAIKKRLFDHWQWLDEMLHYISKSAHKYRIQIGLGDKKNHEKRKSIHTRMTDFEQNQEKVRNKMNTKLGEKTKNLVSEMNQYISSELFKTTFCEWKDSNLPPQGDKWEFTMRNMKKAFEYKFEELLIKWENEKRIYAEIHSSLMEEFIKSFNLLEEDLEDIERTMHGREMYDYFESTKPTSLSNRKFRKTNTIWLPVGFVIALKRVVTEKMDFEKYKQDRRSFVEKAAGEFLNSLPKDIVSEYAEKQMEKTKSMLSKYGSSIPDLIDSNRKMALQIKNETSAHCEILQLYEQIESNSRQIQEKMTSLGIELYPLTVDECDLEWKNDVDSCIGEGEFSSVYKGKLRNDGRITLSPNDDLLVAVKVFKHPLDFVNQRQLCTEQNFRNLDHKNVAKFFGVVNIDTSNQLKENEIALVTELYETNLRSIIFKSESNYTPAKASNTRQAIKTFLNWGKEIADGLAYIHEEGLVHKHLKLDNILVNPEGPAKITDIGFVGQIVETKESFVYLAPEVLENLMIRKKEADIYSYGIMLWEMWYGTQAFTELMPLDKTTFQAKIADGYRPIKDKKEISLPEIQTIMESCWRSPASERPTAKMCYDNLMSLD